MASYEITVEFDKSYEKILKKVEDFDEIFNSIKFKEFIRDKVIEEMKIIIAINAYDFGDGEEHSVFAQKVSEYRKGNKSEITDDYIIIYNNTRLEQSEMTWVKPDTLKKYPNGISISKLIEYGSGLLGTNDDDWIVNLNNHKASWSYKDPEGRYRHSKGIQGRFIYKKTVEVIKKKFNSWVAEYINREMS